METCSLFINAIMAIKGVKEAQGSEHSTLSLIKCCCTVAVRRPTSEARWREPSIESRETTLGRMRLM